jgi:large subunit ribosomal protein L2
MGGSMSLKSFKPINSSTRGLILVDRSQLWKGGPVKELTVGLTSTGGRNNLGRVTVRNRGGGHKRRYRIIDFRRNKTNMWATVERFEYDPNRTAFIALLKYEDESLSYIIAPQKLSVGDRVISSSDGADIKPGNSMPLKSIPVGTMIHNVELKCGAGGKLARSAGTYAQLIGRDGTYSQIRLSSGELRMVLSECFATIGAVSNPDQKNINLAKAGRSRWLGRRPHVRGVAMNPVDHPHGGGEGRTSGGRHPVSPWGQCAKGKKTRTNKRTSRFIMRRRDR